MEPGSRVVTGSVGTAVSWLLEGIVFVVVGLQLRDVVVGIGMNPPGVVAIGTVIVVAVLVAVRFAWLLLADQALPAILRRRHARWSESMLTAWAGMRGAVSLAAVLTLPILLPDGRAFPQRDLIVFITFVVILVTLLGQGLTLPWMARRLTPTHEHHEDAREEARARREAADAGLACLERLCRDEPGRDEVVDQLRRRMQNRVLGADEHLAQLDPDGPAPDGELPRETYRRYGQAMLVAERARLLSLRDAGRLSEDAFVRIQRELDLEQAALLVR